MTKHTPGPWEAFIRDELVEVRAPNAVPIVSWPGFDDSDRAKEEHDANARLIAAAPDLLAACERFVAAMRRGDKIEVLDLIEALHGADAAIQAATGETE